MAFSERGLGSSGRNRSLLCLIDCRFKWSSAGDGGSQLSTGYYARLLKTCFHRFSTAPRIFMHNTRRGEKL